MKRVVLDELTRVPSKGTCCTAEEGRTRQEDAKAADINVIMAQMARGIAPAPREGVFMDVSEIGDFRTMVETVRRGKEAFEALDADVRAAFENDPVLFVDAFKSEEGIAKLRELKVIAETEETLADRREAASEARADKRREAREVAKRVEAAKLPPVPPVGPTGADRSI